MGVETVVVECDGCGVTGTGDTSDEKSESIRTHPQNGECCLRRSKVRRMNGLAGAHRGVILHKLPFPCLPSPARTVSRSGSGHTPRSGKTC